MNVICTLPLTVFSLGDQHRKRKAEHLKKTNVVNMTGQPLATINKVLVAPEGIPAWDSLYLDDSGFITEAYEDAEKVMIIDIGGTTTDIAVMTTDNQVEKRKSKDLGVMNITAELDILLRKDPELKHSTDITQSPRQGTENQNVS